MPPNADTRAPERSDAANRCPACGLLFYWLRNQQNRLRQSRSPQHAGDDGVTPLQGACWQRSCTSSRASTSSSLVSIRGLRGTIRLGCLLHLHRLVGRSRPFREIGNSFMHNINLVFHEAGHILFIPFGNFMSVLGGSLGQLIMPLVVMLVFAFRYQNALAHRLDCGGLRRA